MNAAVLAMRRKRLLRRFRDAGAIDPFRAVTLESLGERRTWIFTRMERRGVLIDAGDARYYLDEGREP